MDWVELSIILKYYDHRYRDSWEQMRSQMTLLANVNSKKPVKSTDIVRFSWDKVDKPQKIDAKKQKALEERAKMFEQKFQSQCQPI